MGVLQYNLNKTLFIELYFEKFYIFHMCVLSIHLSGARKIHCGFVLFQPLRRQCGQVDRFQV